MSTPDDSHDAPWGEPPGPVERLEFELAVTNAHAAVLERHVVALEAVAATRWPLRILAAARLGRSLRQSVRHLPGDTFTQRRYEANALELHDEPDDRSRQRRWPKPQGRQQEGEQ